MENDQNQDEQIKDYLDAKLDVLDWADEHLFVAELLYESEEYGRIHLPDGVPLFYVDINGDVIEDRKFAPLWNSLKDRNYKRVTDRAPLTILELAKVWLNFVITRIDFYIKQQTIEAFDGSVINLDRFVPENQDSRLYKMLIDEDDVNIGTMKTNYNIFLIDLEDAKDEDKITMIKDLIISEIQPIFLTEFTTSVSFTQKELIIAARILQQYIVDQLNSQSFVFSALNNLTNNYEDVEPVRSFDTTIAGVTFELTIKMKGNPNNEYIQAIEEELFNDVTVDASLPVCILNLDEFRVKSGFVSKNKRYFKLYRPPTKPDHAYKIFEQYKLNGWINADRALTIYFFLYIGDEYTISGRNRRVVNDASFDRRKYVGLVFSFKPGVEGFNKITITLPNTNIDKIIDKMNAHFTNFEIVKPQKTGELQGIDADQYKEMTKIETKFIIPYVNIDKDIFMDHISSTPVSATIMRFSEIAKPLSQSKQLKFVIYYLGNIKVNIKQNHVGAKGGKYSLENGAPVSLFHNDIYVSIRITSDDYVATKLTKFLLLRFFRNYLIKYDDIFNFYIEFLPKKQEINPYLDTHAGETVDKDGSIIKQLRQADPDLWNNCQYVNYIATNTNLQVMPIRADEVKKYQNMGRDVILWPVELLDHEEKDQTVPTINPKTGEPLRVFYTTSTDESKYIKLVPNVKGANKLTHPFIPKCQKTKSDIIIHEDNNWAIQLTSRINQSKNILKTTAVLLPGRISVVSKNLSFILGFRELFLLGVNKSPSSAIYSILLAEAGGDNTILKDLADNDEEMIKTIREHLAGNARVCCQENPGLTVEEIAANILDSNRFLDPLLYYRAMEELFNIHIFVMRMVESASMEFEFEAPNFSQKYIRLLRKDHSGTLIRDKAVVLMRKSDKYNKNIIQCELLTHIKDDVKHSFFIENALKRMLDIRQNLTRTIQIKPVTIESIDDDGEQIIKQVLSVDVSNNNQWSLPEFIYENLTRQEIDFYGKCVKFNLNVQYLEPKINVTFFTEPIEPFPYTEHYKVEDPVECETHYIDFKNWLIVREALQENSISFKETSFVTVDLESNVIIGVWILLNDIEMFVPLKPLTNVAINCLNIQKPKKNSSKPNLNGPNDNNVNIDNDNNDSESLVPFRIDVPPGFNIKASLINTKIIESPTEKLARLQKVIMMYIQIVKRLFVAAEQSPEQFVNENITVVPGFYLDVTESDVNNTALKIRRIVKNTNDYNELLNYFALRFPKLFVATDNIDIPYKLVADSDRFKSNIFERLSRFSRDINEEENIFGNAHRLTKFPSFLSHYYVTSSDFIQHSPHEVIFMSPQRLELQFLIEKENSHFVVQNITPDLSTRKAPYFYLHKGKHLYMIQNMYEGNLLSSITASSYWQLYKVNYGYFTPRNTTDRNIVEIQANNPQINNNSDIMILSYITDKTYAAIMPIN